MLRLVVVCVLALFLASAEATNNLKQCKKGEPLPLSVTIDGCVDPPCDVYKGSTAVMEVHFVGTKNDVNKLTAIVHATTFGLTVPYELPENVANVCQNLMFDANCPLYATEDVVYKFNFYIDNSYPEISVKVQVSLVDEDGDSHACFAVDCKVRKGTGAGSANEQLQIA